MREWAVGIAAADPADSPAAANGASIRQVGVMYAEPGCQWRANCRKDLAAETTGMIPRACGTRWDGTLDRIHHALYLKGRETARVQEASPTACIDRQSEAVKSAEKARLHRRPTLRSGKLIRRAKKTACSGPDTKACCARKSSPPPTFRIAANGGLAPRRRPWETVSLSVGQICSPTANGAGLSRALSILPISSRDRQAIAIG